MAIHHAAPTEIIDIRPLGAKLKGSKTAVVVKTDALEVIRIVIPAGKQLPPHRVEGEITVQCLEGRIAFDADGAERELTQGEMLYLAGGATHALRGIEDASILVTILLG
ncbi:MAG TPA: cupin domain-containing protein [Pirellulales bacterium]|nr:cupin domain-containing protein [Pirellulales bacterium]